MMTWNLIFNKQKCYEKKTDVNHIIVLTSKAQAETLQERYVFNKVSQIRIKTVIKLGNTDYFGNAYQIIKMN